MLTTCKACKQTEIGRPQKFTNARWRGGNRGREELRSLLPAPCECKQVPLALSGLSTRSYGMVILAPEQPKPAPAPIKPVAVVDHFDRKLIEVIGQPDDQPVPLWPVIHGIIEGERPVDRTRRRQLCSRLLCRLRGLIRAGKIVRESKSHVRLGGAFACAVTGTKSGTRTVKELAAFAVSNCSRLGQFSWRRPAQSRVSSVTRCRCLTR